MRTFSETHFGVARLSLFALCLALATIGCDEGQDATPPPSRVVAVTAAGGPSPEDVCSKTFTASDAPEFKVPPLADGHQLSLSDRPTWVNFWATWCKPCTEELPLLTSWQADAATRGQRYDVAFISLDHDDAALATFREAHPSTPDSVRVADPAGLSEWAASMGVEALSTLPVQMLLDKSHRVRCVRAGAVRERDRETIEHLLK